jgi:FkbM family methyltransferase
MVSLKQLKSDFMEGRTDKTDYIDKIHEIHKYLFEYADFIKNTDVSKIEIVKDTVVMTLATTGAKIICNKNDKRTSAVEVLNFDCVEKPELNMMRKLIKEHSTILDIGANIGWYTVNLPKLIPNVQIYSFEPVPETFDYLRQNIEINNLENIKIFNFGFYDKEEIIPINYYPEYTGGTSIAKLLETDKVHSISCKFRKLDNFINENDLKVDFIKCDTEGAEIFVFQGGLETLRNQRPIIFTEMLRKWAAKFNYHPNDMIKLFNNIGYKCFYIDGDYLSEIKLMTDEILETNFFFLPEERKSFYKNLLLVNQ